MPGWFRAATVAASRWKRCRKLVSLEYCSARTLIATGISSRGCVDRYTTPQAPRPSSASIGYGPSCVVLNLWNRFGQYAGRYAALCPVAWRCSRGGRQGVVLKPVGGAFDHSWEEGRRLRAVEAANAEAAAALREAAGRGPKPARPLWRARPVSLLLLSVRRRSSAPSCRTCRPRSWAPHRFSAPRPAATTRLSCP